MDEKVNLNGWIGVVGVEIVGVALVESIDKGSIFDLHYSTDR